MKLEELAKDDRSLLEGLDQIKRVQSNPRSIHTLTINLAADASCPIAKLRQRFVTLTKIIARTKALISDTKDKTYFLNLFALFLRDHSARVNRFEEDWEEAKEDYEYLLSKSEGVNNYYTGANGWVKRCVNYCSIMIMLKSGKDKSFIKNTAEYKTLKSSGAWELDKMHWPKIHEIMVSNEIEKEISDAEFVQFERDFNENMHSFDDDSLSKLETHQRKLGQLLEKVPKLDVSQKRTHYEKCVPLWLNECSAIINRKKKNWKEAKENHEYLVSYQRRNPGCGSIWELAYVYCCDIMIMKSRGMSIADIKKAPQYKSLISEIKKHHEPIFFDKRWPEVYEIIHEPPFKVVRISGIETCPICQDEVKNSAKEPLASTFCNCKYFYHKECIEETIRTTYHGHSICPVCKAKPD